MGSDCQKNKEGNLPGSEGVPDTASFAAVFLCHALFDKNPAPGLRLGQARGVTLNLG